MSRSYSGAAAGVSAAANNTFHFMGQDLAEEPRWYMQGADTGGNSKFAVFGLNSSEVPLAGFSGNDSYTAVGGTGTRGFINNAEWSGERPRGYTTTLNTQSVNPVSGIRGCAVMVICLTSVMRF